MPQNEARSTTDGFGWSRQPQFNFNPEANGFPRRRISASDRYVVFNSTHTIVFELRDDGYLGYSGVTIVSVREKKRSSRIFRTFLPLGGYEMPNESDNGAIRHKRKDVMLNFVAMEGGSKIILTDIPKQGNSRNIRGEIVLSEPEPVSGPAESLVCKQPWRGDGRAFRYSRCSPWFTVEGVVQLGTTEIVFTKGSSWGIFEWNRGVRPRSDTRVWAAACGTAGGRLAGFTVGHGTEDDSAGTGNAFFVDGVLHKLDQITFHIPPANWLSPWRFTGNDGRLEMTFTPQQERSDRLRFLFHSFTRRQLFGSFSGRAILDDGSTVEFGSITGIAERVKTRF